MRARGIDSRSAGARAARSGQLGARLRRARRTCRRRRARPACPGLPMSCSSAAQRTSGLPAGARVAGAQRVLVDVVRVKAVLRHARAARQLRHPQFEQAGRAQQLEPGRGRRGASIIRSNSARTRSTASSGRAIAHRAERGPRRRLRAASRAWRRSARRTQRAQRVLAKARRPDRRPRAAAGRRDPRARRTDPTAARHGRIERHRVHGEVAAREILERDPAVNVTLFGRRASGYAPSRRNVVHSRRAPSTRISTLPCSMPTGSTRSKRAMTCRGVEIRGDVERLVRGAAAAARRAPCRPPAPPGARPRAAGRARPAPPPARERPPGDGWPSARRAARRPAREEEWGA